MVRMRPGLSVRNIRPSGAKSIAHGVSRPRARVSTLKSGVAAFNRSWQLAPAKIDRSTNSCCALIAIGSSRGGRASPARGISRKLISRGRHSAASHLRGFRRGGIGGFPNGAQIGRVWVANAVLFENLCGGFQQILSIEYHRLVRQYPRAGKFETDTLISAVAENFHQVAEVLHGNTVNFANHGTIGIVVSPGDTTGK